MSAVRIVKLSIAFLVSTAAALPSLSEPENALLRLTSENWTTQINRGAWLIEFTSPYCPSCRAFAPTWQELATNKRQLRIDYQSSPFSLATIDCHANSKLCEEQGVRHMPRLSVYQDGSQVLAEYQGNREYTELSAFIDKEAAHYREIKQRDGSSSQDHKKVESHDDLRKHENALDKKPSSEVSPVHHLPIQEAKPKSTEQVISPPPPAGPNPFGTVLQYGKDEMVKDPISLQKILSKENKSASFVKFFAPWCPHCRAMASAFMQVAEALKGRIDVIEVDCEVHHSVCLQYEIRGFPTLRMYNDGEATEYKGGRSFEAMRTWALKAGSALGVREINIGELESISKTEDVYFLYLHSPQTPEAEVEAVTRATRILLTTPVHAYRSSDEHLLDRYRSQLSKSTSESNIGSISGILAFKDHNADQPTSAFYPLQSGGRAESEVIAEIAAWLDSERYATVSEVTGSTFSDILYNRQKAPVVLAALSDVHHSGRQLSTGTGATLRDEELLALRSIALQWRDRKGISDGTTAEIAKQRPQKVIFAWIDYDRWATALQKYYNVKAGKLPRLILADGSRLQYYDLPSRFVDPFAASRQQSWLDTEQVFGTLDAIWQGKGPRAKSSRTYFDRGVHETASFIESILIFIANHTFISLLAIMGFVGGFVSYLRHQSQRYAGGQSYRLPQYGKVD